MSVPTEPQYEPAGSGKLDSRPLTTPRLPIVHIGAEDPIRVYYSAEEAVDAAREGPEDEFFDMRGICLTRVEDADESPYLEARGDGDPEALKQRMLNELRTVIELAAPDEAVAAAAEKAIRWAAEAPDLEHMVHALWFADGDYGADDQLSDERPCRRCSAAQIARYGIPPCCPGAA